jgi:hypothetical protein
MSVEIRPGVHRPDWSVVTTAAARNALFGRDRARQDDLLRKWQHVLDPTHDRVWRTIIELFARLGRPPQLREISDETGIPIEALREIVAELEAHDLLGSNKAADLIRYAYPFNGEVTEHSVQLHGRSLHALCPIDALGVGGMFGTDVVITTACRTCGDSIEIATTENGVERSGRPNAFGPRAPAADLDGRIRASSCFSTERALLDQTCACRARVLSGRAAAKRPGATNPYGLDLEVRPKR